MDVNCDNFCQLTDLYEELGPTRIEFFPHPVIAFFVIFTPGHIGKAYA